jgi:hypothetical protein
MSPNTCHCCDGLIPPTPITADNRPGLSAIANRVGTYASFRAAMLQAIAGIPELAALHTRIDSDYAITVLDLWAIVADVLTFYQERIANEGYLRTSRLRDSLLRLTRLIDYNLRPGLAATTLLSFTLEKNSAFTLAAGFQVQSVPGPGETPQKFETLESVAADWRLNRLRVMPAPFEVFPLAAGSTGGLLAPSPENASAANALAVGDRLMLAEPGSTLTQFEILTVGGVQTVEDRIRLQWTPAIKGTTWNAYAALTRLKRTVRPFAFDAPATYMSPVLDSGNHIISWVQQATSNIISTASGTGTVLTADSGGIVLALDAIYDKIAVGSQMVLAVSPSDIRVLTVTAVGQGSVTLGPITRTVTLLTIDYVLSDIAKTVARSTILIYELDSVSVNMGGLDYPGVLATSSVFIPGRRVGATRIEVARSIIKGKYQAGFVIDAKELAPAALVLLDDASQQPVSGSIVGASLFGDNVSIAATLSDPTTAGQLGLTAEKATSVTGLASGLFEVVPDFTSPKPEMQVTIGNVGPRKISLTSQPRYSSDVASQLQALLNAADADELFAAARVVDLYGKVLVLPGLPRADVTFAATAADTSTVQQLALDSTQTIVVSGLLSAPLNPFPVLLTASPEVAISFGPIGPLTLSLSGVVDMNSLTNAFFNIYSLDPSLLVQFAGPWVVDDRFLVLSGSYWVPAQEYLRLDLNLEIPNGTMLQLDSASAVLLGNVALASHGETVKPETVGDGNAAVAFQKFALKKSPLTYVPSASEGGVQSSLQVLVNRALWKGVPTLYGTAATDQIYRTRMADDGTTTLEFGDGITGARVPTGRGNILAMYRKGVGLAGRVRANTLSTAVTRPVGFKSVNNPLPADGGADPESIDGARQNAPGTVRTFGRAVSLLDFEDLVRTSGEVAKASASWVWNGESRAIHLTIAGQQGGVFSIDALNTIHSGLDQERDPNHLLILDNFVRVPVVVGATLGINPARVSADIQAAAQQALLQALSFDELGFGMPVHESFVYAVLQDVDGVDWVRLTLLQFKDQSPANLTLRGADSQPVQDHLRIFPARTTSDKPPKILPAEQAWIEHPEIDVVLLTQGGLTAGS